MNTPTKRIFYLFEAKIAKNEPQTKVWGSLTCKSQCSRPFTDGHGRSRLFAAAFAPVAAGRSRFRARSRRSQPVPCPFALVAPVRGGCACVRRSVHTGRSRFRARSCWSRYSERYLENAATIPSAVVWPKTSADFASSMKMPIRL